MVNIVAKSSPLNVKACLKLRLAEMRQRLTQRAAEKQTEQAAMDKFKQSNEENLIDSGLVDSQFLNSNEDESDISFEIIEILSQQCQNYSKNSSRTSTPIFNKSMDKKQKVPSARKVQKISKRSSSSKKQRATPSASLSKKYAKQTDLNYIDLNRNNDYNYNINSQCSTEADMFYKSNSGFQDFGGLKIWYV